MRKLHYEAELLTFLLKLAYFHPHYAQLLTIYRKLWTMERRNLLDRIPKRKRSTVYKQK